MIPYPLFTSRLIQQRSFRMKENTDDLREEIEKLNQELSSSSKSNATTSNSGDIQ